MAAVKLVVRAIEKVLTEIISLWTTTIQLPAVLRERVPQIESDLVQRPPPGNIYAVVVKYFGREVDGNIEGLLKTLAARGVNTVLVFNSPPAPGDMARVGPLVQRVIVRRNIGRDFGAYRAAALTLIRDGIKPDRLLFFNDSLFYLPGPELDHMIDEMAGGKADVVGSFENHARAHHIGSFAFSISGEVFTDPAIQQFWRRYWPLDGRRHAIHRGEMKLSRLYRRRGFTVDVVYGLDKLSDRMRDLSLAEIISLRPYRPRFGYHPMTEVPRKTKKSGMIGVSEATNTALTTDPALRDRIVRDILIEQMLVDVENSSQIHFGFGLYHKLMAAPLIKRDLLRQGIFAEQDLSTILDDVDPQLKQVIIRDLISRQRPIHLTYFERFMRRNGLR